MKRDVFYWVLNAGVHGGLVCLLIWALRSFKALPRRAVFVLWLGPLVRLTVPFGASLPWSFLALLRRLGARPVALPGPTGPTGDLFQAVNSLQAADSYFPIVYKTDALRGLFETCALIWVIGAAACALCAAALYVMTRLSLRDARRVGADIWVSEKVLAPGLVGVLRPRILLPPGMEQGPLRFVLAHERTHRRRLDNLWRLLAIGVCCLHWYNPLVWFSLRLFFADMELACDETVLRKLNAADRPDYARALVGAAEGTGLFVSAFGGAKLRLRVERVLSYRRLTLGAAVVSALLAGFILSTLIFT